MRTLGASWAGPDDQFPPEIFHVKGMIGKNERKMLYSFARDGLEGVGQVVDAGAFLGSSALCLAAGLAENGLDPNFSIHSYDLFVARQVDVVEAISRLVRPTKFEDGYLDIFLQQTEKYKKLIRPNPGDLLDYSWGGGPVELLFVDVCKSPALNCHVIDTFFRSLVVGRSVLIQQDYLHVWHPYIHWTMDTLSDHFDIEFSLVDSSRVYRLRSPLSKELLDRIVANKIEPEEKIARLERMREAGPGWQVELADGLVLRQLHLDGLWEQLDEKWAEICKTYGPRLTSALDSDYLPREMARVYADTKVR